MKVSKKMKRPPKNTSFDTSVPKIMIISYTVHEIWHVTNVIVIFHFGLFFALLPPPLPLTDPKIQNFNKIKNSWRYHHFTQVYQNSLSYAKAYWAIFCVFTSITAQETLISQK